MSRVSQKDTSPEKTIFSFLRKNKLRFRKNIKTLPGSPDIVLTELNAVIFVHGCFWHGHKRCKLAKRPSSNTKYCNKKIDDNIERDKRKAKELRKLGWKVLTVWQCQLKTEEKKEKTFERLSSCLTDLSDATTTRRRHPAKNTAGEHVKSATDG
jgi:DNA mismatch endonuclease (patch repair protein)